MLKKLRCKSCDRKIKKDFYFCPTCGLPLRGKKRREDFGMLGVNDLINEIKLPIGMNGIMKGLVKQLNRELGSIGLDNLEESRPKSFKIQISTKKAQQPSKIVGVSQQPILEEGPSEKEILRRKKLKKVEAVSNVRRLPEAIVYEISTPGVVKRSEVSIANLEDSIEIKAYGKDRCYEKVLPLKAEILGYTVKDEKVVIKLKN